MYQDMYAIKVVRKAVVNSSKCCNTADIIDYDMDACVAQSCSVSWDDRGGVPRRPSLRSKATSAVYSDEYEAASKIVLQAQ